MPSAVPRLVAPNSSANAAPSASTPGGIPSLAASHIARRVGRSTAAHRLDDDAARPLLQHVTGDRAEPRALAGREIEVDDLGVAPLRLVDDRRADIAGADDRGADLELVVAGAQPGSLEHLARNRLLLLESRFQRQLGRHLQEV